MPGRTGGVHVGGHLRGKFITASRLRGRDSSRRARRVRERLHCTERGRNLDLPAGTESPNNGGPPSASFSIHDPGVDLAWKTVCIKVRLSSMGNTSDGAGVLLLGDEPVGSQKSSRSSSVRALSIDHRSLPM